MNEMNGTSSNSSPANDHVSVMKAAHEARVSMWEATLTDVFGSDHVIVQNARAKSAAVLQQHEENVQSGLASPEALRQASQRWEEEHGHTMDISGIPKGMPKEQITELTSKIQKIAKASRTLTRQYNRISAEETGQLFALNPQAEATHWTSQSNGRHLSDKTLPVFVGTTAAAVLKLASLPKGLSQFGRTAQVARKAGSQGVRDIRSAARQIPRPGQGSSLRSS